MESFFDCYYEGNLPEIKNWLDADKPLEKTSLNDALETVARKKWLDIVQYLLENHSERINIHYREDSPVRWACGNNDLDMVKYLVSKGANIKAKHNQALELAVSLGYSDLVVYLESLS